MDLPRRCGAAPTAAARGRALMTVGLAVGLLLGLAAAAFAFDFPALTGRVVDQAAVITEASRTAIEAKSKGLEDKSGIQLVVATVKSLQGGDIESYANQLFRYWKLGEAKKNNGVLLLVAPVEHKVRIEVGYGLEGTLTDALSSMIIQSAILPRFKANDFSGGIERGVDGIISVLSGDAAEWQPRSKGSSGDWLAVSILVILFILVIVAIIVFGIIKGGQSGRGADRGGSIFVPWGGSSGSSDWGSGGSSDGGFSGGGGSSGGGGASGSW